MQQELILPTWHLFALKAVLRLCSRKMPWRSDSLMFGMEHRMHR